MGGFEQMYGQGTWREEQTAKAVSAQRQKSINLLAYHRGAVLVRLHPTGFPTAPIPLLEPTKHMPQTHKQPYRNNSVVQHPKASEYSLFEVATPDIFRNNPKTVDMAPLLEMQNIWGQLRNHWL